MAGKLAKLSASCADDGLVGTTAGAELLDVADAADAAGGPALIEIEPAEASNLQVSTAVGTFKIKQRMKSQFDCRHTPVAGTNQINSTQFT